MLRVDCKANKRVAVFDDKGFAGWLSVNRRVSMGVSLEFKDRLRFVCETRLDEADKLAIAARRLMATA